MKISVVIPAHNEESHIAESLKAVLAQDHSDFEVIVVDNGSTDKTAEIALTFPVTVVFENRKGTMSACERGRQEALGEIIVRMDADCLPETGWLRKGVSLFEDPEVVAATGPYDYYDSHFIFRSICLIIQRYIYQLINLILQWAKKGAVLIGGNSFMRAETLDRIAGFKTSIIFYGDDTDTAKRLSKHGKIIFDPKLTMKTSARRFKREGVIRLQSKYTFHFLKQLFS